MAEKHDLRWLAFAFEAVFAVVTVVVARAYAGEYTHTPFQRCKDGIAARGSGTTSPDRPAPTTPVAPLREPESAGGTTTNPPQAVLNYGHQEGPKSTTLVLPAGSNVDLSRPAVLIGEIRRGAPGGAVFPRDGVHTSLAGRGDFAELNICADSENAADPGNYQGQIEVFTSGGGSLVVPLTVTLADNNLSWVAFGSLLTLLVGNLYLYALFRSLKSDDQLDLDLVRDYISWCGSVKAIVAGAFGLAAAATVFNAQYFSSDTFGSSLWQYPTLFVSMLAAFIGAGSAASVPIKG